MPGAVTRRSTGPSTAPPPPTRICRVTIPYSLALLVSAALLILLEPMVGAFVLPLLGSALEVWPTSILFFQAALLAACGFAHLGSRLPAAPTGPPRASTAGGRSSRWPRSGRGDRSGAPAARVLPDGWTRSVSMERQTSSRPWRP